MFMLLAKPAISSSKAQHRRYSGISFNHGKAFASQNFSAEDSGHYTERLDTARRLQLCLRVDLRAFFRKLGETD